MEGFTGVGGTNRPNLLFRNEGKVVSQKHLPQLKTNIIYEHNSRSNWGDLDNDGDPDLYNDGEIFLNDGEGSFSYGNKVTNRNRSKCCMDRFK
ncbi:MAG: VCBS repeat-containing protein [Bacteroidales bacterium]